MEVTHIASNPRSGKLGTINEDDDDDEVDICHAAGLSVTCIAIVEFLSKYEPTVLYNFRGSNHYIANPQGPVVQKLISTSPGLKFYPMLLFPILQRQIWSVNLLLTSFSQGKSKKYFIRTVIFSLEK